MVTEIFKCGPVSEIQLKCHGMIPSFQNLRNKFTLSITHSIDLKKRFYSDQNGLANHTIFHLILMPGFAIKFPASRE